MKRFSALLAVFALASAKTMAQTTPCNAQSVWERMIEAKGGRSKLHSVDTLFVSGDYVWRNLLVTHRLQVRDLYRFPDFLWGWYNNGTAMLGTSISHCYLDRGLCLVVLGPSQNPQVGRQPIDPSTSVLQEVSVLLLETRWRKPVLGACSELGGAPTIEAIYNDLSYLFHLPKDATLPDRVDIVEPRGTTTYTLSGYERFDGVMLPTRHERAYGMRPPLVLKMKYEINPDYDRSLPNREPSLSEGPDSWRNPKTKPSRRR